MFREKNERQNMRTKLQTISMDQVKFMQMQHLRLEESDHYHSDSITGYIPVSIISFLSFKSSWSGVLLIWVSSTNKWEQPTWQSL